MKKLIFWFYGMLGYAYVVNMSGSKEIHTLKCRHLKYLKRYVVIRKRDLWTYINAGWNGCRFCLKDYDAD